MRLKINDSLVQYSSKAGVTRAIFCQSDKDRDALFVKLQETLNHLKVLDNQNEESKVEEANAPPFTKDEVKKLLISVVS